MPPHTDGLSHVIAVADASKFGERSFVNFAALDEIDRLITDGEPPADVRDGCESAGGSVVEVGS
jgi:DeoR family fructose operon transcriptional repressor